MRGKKGFFYAGVIFMGLALFLVWAVILWDWRTGTDGSVNDRIALLERQMKEQIRPVIQINRATVYNTDGEIVIEGLGN